jgi:hypothetical protein
MEEGVTQHAADGQGDQELNEMLVEDLLHDGDDQNAENAAEGDDDDRRYGGEPQSQVTNGDGIVFCMKMVDR